MQIRHGTGRGVWTDAFCIIVGELGCIKTQRATACHGEHERWRREHGTEKDNDGNSHRKGRARVG